MINRTPFPDSSKNISLQRSVSNLKRKITQLSSELSTGTVSNVNAATKGDYTRLAALNHHRKISDIYLSNNSRVSQDLGYLQSVLNKIIEPIKLLSLKLIDTQGGNNFASFDRSITETKTLFDQIIKDLNVSIAGRSLFSGSATDKAATVGADEILSVVNLHVSNLSSTAEISSAIDTWFLTPGGGFEQSAYLGTAADENLLPMGESAALYAPNISALNPEIRKVLAQLSKVALLDKLNIGDAEISIIIQEAGNNLLTAESSLQKLSAGMGQVEERVEQNRIRLGFNLASIDAALHQIIESDQFKIATELQNALTQIDTVYALTARSANLSLVGYLR